MKIQVDIPTRLNKLLKIEMAKKGHKNLRDTLLDILRKYLVKGVKNES